MILHWLARNGATATRRDPFATDEPSRPRASQDNAENGDSRPRHTGRPRKTTGHPHAGGGCPAGRAGIRPRALGGVVAERPAGGSVGVHSPRRCPGSTRGRAALAGRRMVWRSAGGTSAHRAHRGHDRRVHHARAGHRSNQRRASQRRTCGPGRACLRVHGSVRGVPVPRHAAGRPA